MRLTNFVLPLAGLGLVLAVHSASAQETVTLDLGQQFEFTFDNGETYRVEAGAMRFDLRVEDPDPSDEFDNIVVATFHRKGAADYELSFPTGYSIVTYAGLWQIDRDGQPSLVIQSFTGGAHCCMDIHAVRPDGGGWADAEIGLVDGDEVVPWDIDGDGLVEFEIPDGRFNYTFDAYAYSVPPPMVVATVNGQYADLSADPAYRRIFEQFYDDAAQLCVGIDGSTVNAAPYSSESAPNSACASLLAAGARLGTYQGTKALVQAARLSRPHQDQDWEDYLVVTDTTQDTFTDLLKATEYALKVWGYID